MGRRFGLASVICFGRIGRHRHRLNLASAWQLDLTVSMIVSPPSDMGRLTGLALLPKQRSPFRGAIPAFMPQAISCLRLEPTSKPKSIKRLLGIQNLSHQSRSWLYALRQGERGLTSVQ